MALQLLLENVRLGRIANPSTWQRGLLRELLERPDVETVDQLTIRSLLEPPMSDGDLPWAPIERIEPPKVELPYEETPALLALRARRRAVGR